MNKRKPRKSPPSPKKDTTVRAKKKKVGPKRPNRVSSVRGSKVRWRGFGPDALGGGVHHFSPESLSRAIDLMMQQRDAFIGPSLRSLMDDSPIEQFTMSPLRSDDLCYRIRVRGANAKRREATALLVIARREGDLSKQLEAEYKNMQQCQRIAPHHVLNVYKSGVIYIANMREGSKGGRKVFAHIQAWKGAMSPLTIGGEGQLRILGDNARLLSKEQSEGVRARIFETILRVYDANAGSGLAIRKTSSDCWAATGKGDGTPNIVLVRCAGMMRRCTPARYLNAAVLYRWRGPRGDVAVGPTEADTVRRVTSRVWGREAASEALQAYAEAVRKGRYPEPSAGLLSLLD